MPISLDACVLAISALLLTSGCDLKQASCIPRPELPGCTNIEKVEPARLAAGSAQSLTITFVEDDVFSRLGSSDEITVMLRPGENRPEVPLQLVRAEGRSLKVFVEEGQLSAADGGPAELSVAVGARQARESVRIYVAPRFGQPQTLVYPLQIETEKKKRKESPLQVIPIPSGTANLAIVSCESEPEVDKGPFCGMDILNRARNGELTGPTGDLFPKRTGDENPLTDKYWIGVVGSVIFTAGPFEKALRFRPYSATGQLGLPVGPSYPQEGGNRLFADPEGEQVAIASYVERGASCIPTLDVFSPALGPDVSPVPLGGSFKVRQLAFGTTRLVPEAQPKDAAADARDLSVILAVDSGWTSLIWQRSPGGQWIENRELGASVTLTLLGLKNSRRVPAGLALRDMDRDGMLDLLIVSAPGGTQGAEPCPTTTPAPQPGFLVHILSALNIEGDPRARSSSRILNDVVLPQLTPTTPSETRSLAAMKVTSAAFGDLDHDGDVDLAVADREGRTVVILPNEAR